MSAGRPVSTLTCTICGGKHYARGLCKHHYVRAKDAGKLPPLIRDPEKPCKEDGCDEPHYSLGWCRLHYRRNYRGERERQPRRKPDPDAPGRLIRTGCDVDGCDRPHEARGLCGLHYRQQRYERTPREVHDKGCTVLGCGNPHRSRGLCEFHYRADRAGRELRPRSTPKRERATAGNLPAGWDRTKPVVHPKPNGSEIVVMVGAIPEDVWAEWAEAVEALLRRRDALDLADMLGLVAA